MMTIRQQSLWLLGALLGTAVLVWLLKPILTPFVISAGLAYLGDPIADQLERYKLSRMAATSVVFLTLSLIGLGLMILLLPMLQEQIASVIERLPRIANDLQTKWLPRIGIQLPEGATLNVEALREMVKEHWADAGGVMAGVLGSVTRSGAAALGFIANLLLIPIVTFYLLRDWDVIVERVGGLIPPRYLPVVGRLAGETDEVLSAFIRGQLLVMLSLSAFYVLGFYLIGLELALLIGLIAGMISFIPYLGMIVGIALATLAMLLQEPSLIPLVLVWTVCGVGQVLESAILTPLLVGDRIGLHPVAVIFAVLAGGQLFGFVGVLLALPAAAALAVLLRFAQREWVNSELYTRDAPEPDPVTDEDAGEIPAAGSEPQA